MDRSVRPGQISFRLIHRRQFAVQVSAAIASSCLLLATPMQTSYALVKSQLCQQNVQPFIDWDFIWTLPCELNCRLQQDPCYVLSYGVPGGTDFMWCMDGFWNTSTMWNRCFRAIHQHTAYQLPMCPTCMCSHVHIQFAAERASKLSGILTFVSTRVRRQKCSSIIVPTTNKVTTIIDYKHRSSKTALQYEIYVNFTNVGYMCLILDMLKPQGATRAYWSVKIDSR